MAKKEKKNKIERVILEDIELKPQVIGYVYQKKSNIGRVIFIFVVFALAVFYINDISVFINNLLGKKTPESVINNTSEKKEQSKKPIPEKEEVVYNVFSNTLEIKEENVTLNNFNLTNNTLTFDIDNKSSKVVDLSSKKYFIETYNENKTLIDRFKMNVNSINEGSKISFSFDTSNSFYYIVLSEKTIKDYPAVNLKNDESGKGTIVCTKGIESITYTFVGNELKEVSHTITENTDNSAEYYTRYNTYQNLVASYKDTKGVTATFNGSLNGYTAVIDIDSEKASLNKTNAIYYFEYNEFPKVVKFEMQTNGFTCQI